MQVVRFALFLPAFLALIGPVPQINHHLRPVAFCRAANYHSP
jgi:hypothetical protein